MFELAQRLRASAMTAYVELQEHEFALEEYGYTATRHQREVGAGYFDLVTQAVSPDSVDARAQGLDRGGAVRGVSTAVGEEILTTEALAFVERLQRELNPRRLELLERRQERQLRARRRREPGLPRRRRGRSARATGSVAPAPRDLQDRRCEITGPVERKMMINALNSGARVFMADFEDANSPTWENVVAGPGRTCATPCAARSRSTRRRRATA